MSSRSLKHSGPQNISYSLSFAHPLPFLLLLFLPLPQGCTTLHLLLTSYSCFSVGSSMPIAAYQSQRSASPLAKLAETSGPTPDPLRLVGKSGSDPQHPSRRPNSGAKQPWRDPKRTRTRRRTRKPRHRFTPLGPEEKRGQGQRVRCRESPCQRLHERDAAIARDPRDVVVLDGDEGPEQRAAAGRRLGARQTRQTSTRCPGPSADQADPQAVQKNNTSQSLVSGKFPGHHVRSGTSKRDRRRRQGDVRRARREPRIPCRRRGSTPARDGRRVICNGVTVSRDSRATPRRATRLDNVFATRVPSAPTCQARSALSVEACFGNRDGDARETRCGCGSVGEDHRRAVLAGRRGAGGFCAAFDRGV